MYGILKCTAVIDSWIVWIFDLVMCESLAKRDCFWLVLTLLNLICSKPFQQVILDYDYTFTTPYCGSETIGLDMEKVCSFTQKTFLLCCVWRGIKYFVEAMFNTTCGLDGLIHVLIENFYVWIFYFNVKFSVFLFFVIYALFCHFFPSKRW